MNDQVHTMEPSGRFGYAMSQAQRNKVLRNTYWLLSLSLIPTVLGAWAGVELNIAPLFRGVLGFVLFLAVAFGFIFAIEKTKNSAAGVPVLLVGEREVEGKTCALCHGGRVYPEFTGEYGGNADIHYQKGMSCAEIHSYLATVGVGQTRNLRERSDELIGRL